VNPFNYIKENIFGIDKLNISDDEKVSKTIRAFAVVCAATAIQPIPFADILILTPIQAIMGTRIAKIRGYNFTISQVYKEILGVIGMAYMFQQGVIGLYKLGLPFLGAITTIPLVFVLTYAGGKMMDFYFVAKTKGQNISKEDLKNAFKDFRKQAKKDFSKDEIKKEAKRVREEILKDQNRNKEFIKNNIDDLSIFSVMHNFKYGKALLNEEENIILQAIIRSSKSINNLEDAKDFVNEMIDRGPEAMMGAANNIKGIAHELKYVKMENEDGDEIYAFLPEDTNNAEFDLIRVNKITNEQEYIQLKATSSTDVLDAFYEKYPNSKTKLVASDEIARKEGVESSGISNEKLSNDVDNLLQKLSTMDVKLLDELIEKAPALTVISASFALYELFKRYKKNEITKNKFIYLGTKLTGIKAAKITTILALLSIPVVGQITAVYLISKLMLETMGYLSPTKKELLLPAPSNS
jgi:uncharacterized protein (DUF697 family)